LKATQVRKIKTFDVINTLILMLFALICVYPFYYLIIYSLSNSIEAARHGMWLFPKGFTVENYSYLLQKGDILSAALISALRAVIGTLITLFCSSLYAFLLSKKQLPFRKVMYRMLVITMYLNAGLIPYFIVMKAYHLNNNFLLYIIPSAVGAFYVILIKTYIEQIPQGMQEAAHIDGAGYFTTYLRVIMPVCLPVLATIAVFSAVNQWNAWQDNFYLVRDRNLKTLQLLLLEYLQNMDSTIISDINIAAQRASQTSSLSLKTCISVLTMLPIMLVYPFLQRYFIKGILIGSIKG
jgi:putative aldouronate transport system permease protein